MEWQRTLVGELLDDGGELTEAARDQQRQQGVSLIFEGKTWYRGLHNEVTSLSELANWGVWTGASGVTGLDDYSGVYTNTAVDANRSGVDPVLLAKLSKVRIPDGVPTDDRVSNSFYCHRHEGDAACAASRNLADGLRSYDRDASFLLVEACGHAVSVESLAGSILIFARPQIRRGSSAARPDASLLRPLLGCRPASRLRSMIYSMSCAK